MLCVRSFHAIRPRGAVVSSVAALPYDVMNEEEARGMAEGLPYSFLRISRPEIEFERGVDAKSEAVYQRSRENLQKFIDDGVMQVDAQPQIFLYRLIMGGHAQTGIVACAHIDDYIEGRIRKHEFTRLDKELDRMRHVRTVGAHTGPVFLAFRDDAAIAAQMDIDTKTEAIYDFVTSDGVQHTVWQSVDAAFYERAFESHEAAYIADGHHRAASAARVGADLRSEAADPQADGAYLHFLAVFFPASSLNILAYNRVLNDVNERSTAEILDCLRALGSLEETRQKEPQKAGEFCLYIDKKWYRFVLDPKLIDHSDPVASLDASLLQDKVLGPVFGIGDPRTDEHIDFVGGIRGTAGLEARVDSGERRLAFSMYPTQMEQILKVSDAGQVMPPKSTWFEPKLRSGLFVHRFF